ncbi:MAG: hypothetical protein PHU36_05240 [Syntrophomonadaceae bacterium]|nr:hypothetical protein [Syntrophomonadaceae bacterium]
MRKSRLGVFLILTLLASFTLGYSISHLIPNHKNWNITKKPTVNTISLERRIHGDTAIVWEKEYVLSSKMQVSDFTDKEKILGKTLTEIKKLYRADNGFKVFWENQTLIIHQRIDDWTPEDKAELRLQVFQDRVAVYQGPDEDNDTLLKITGIVFSRLPIQIQQDIEAGKYEFADEQSLNDALENLDEYQ